MKLCRIVSLSQEESFYKLWAGFYTKNASPGGMRFSV